jgi:hypothetical protein
MKPRYLARQIDTAGFELMPDGTLRVHQAHAQPIELPPTTTYAIYLLMRSPGVAPMLRALDDDRQRQLWDARYATE